MPLFVDIGQGRKKEAFAFLGYSFAAVLALGFLLT